MLLLTSQKNELFDIINQKGLSPNLFLWDRKIGILNNNREAEIIKFANSEYFFSFETNNISDEKHTGIFCPGDTIYKQTVYPGYWIDQKTNFKNWLTYLLREISAPNKWERFNKELEQLNFNSEQNNDKFSFSEVEELKSKIEFLKIKIQKIENLPAGSLEILNDKLDYLVEQSKILTKFDWKSMFIGIIINIVMALAIPPDSSKEIWKAISEVFQNFLLLSP